MYEYAFSDHLMGVTCSVSIVTESESHATELFSLVRDRLRGYEAQFSRFISESELSKLNRERTTVVSPLFISLLRIAQKLYHATDGYFNPLLQINKLGYTQSFENIQQTIPHSPLQPYNTNFSMVRIEDTTRTVTLVDDQLLDFGGFLKGYLAENEAKRIMYEHPDVSGIIVNIGGDLHTRGKDAEGNIFVFDIHNPLSTQGIAIPIQNSSLATSGTYQRSWNIRGEHVHHILERDGLHNPKSNVLSASVIHQSGATAEAYAKVLLTLQPDTLSAIIEEPVQCVVIHTDGRIHTSL